MTPEDFRDSAYRAELAEIITSPAFVEARQIISDRFNAAGATMISEPEVASVRLLALRAGYELAFTDLVTLSTPLLKETEAPESDFGAPDEAMRLAGMDLPPAFKKE